MFIVALFTVAKLWKPPKCPSTHKWLKKMWGVCVCVCVCKCVYVMEYYSAVKRNKILLFAAT